MNRALGAYLTGDAILSARLHEEALEYMRTSGARRNLVRALLHCSGRTIETTGNFSTARGYLDEMLLELSRQRSKLVEAQAYKAVSFYEFERGDASAARIAGDLAISAARDAGVPRVVGE